jgi:hypothetical protein
LLSTLGLAWSTPPEAYEAFSALFVPRNLLPEYPGRAWPGDAARKAAAALRTQAGVVPWVLLGRRVATAFGLGAASYFWWYEMSFGPTVVIPHPSGKNRLWNDPGVADRVGDTLQEAMMRGRET